MSVFTLTLNPAFDLHCNAESFVPYTESIVEIISKDAGGKGVNISRALTAAGAKNTAVVILGEENGDEFYRMAKREGLTLIPIVQKGRIRENITLHKAGKSETRISFGGFPVNRELLSSVITALGAHKTGNIITFSGSIPFGSIDRDKL